MAAIQRSDIFKTIFARVQFYIIDRGLDDTCTALAYTFAEYEAYSRDLVVAILQLLCDLLKSIVWVAATVPRERNSM